MNLNAYHLRKDEVQYELKIRGLPHEGGAGELRKLLSQGFSNNTPIDSQVVNNIDTNAEINSCELKYRDLSNLVEEYEGTYSDSEYTRILARLWHLYLRIQRIPVPASLDDGPEQKKIELEGNSKTLLDSFTAAKHVPEDSSKEEPLVQLTEENGSENLDASRDAQIPTMQAEDNKTLLTMQRNIPPGTSHLIPPNLNLIDVTLKVPAASSSTKISQFRPCVTEEVHHRSSSAIPVYKWNVKFDYESGQSVGAFLQRVEELRRARGMSRQELFESAVDLFEGKALTWYRSTIHRIKSWEELCEEMRIVFQTPDYNFRLQQEIFTRFQGENEPIDLYIAAMEGLYGRLSFSIPESTRLSQILNNLHPLLQDRLALCEITSLEDLRIVGRKAEAGRLRASMARPTPRSCNVLEPDLAYGESSRRKGLSFGKVASMAPNPSEQRKPMKCWNCNMNGHRFAYCRKPRNKFCFGCGNPDTVKADCTKCNQKNG